MPKKPKSAGQKSAGRSQSRGSTSNVLAFPGGRDAVRDLVEQLNITPDMLSELFGGGLGSRFMPQPLTVPDPPKSVSTYRVRVDLRGAKPPIWRRLELAGDLTLDIVHDVLQVSMGWYDGHLHAFRFSGDRRHFLTADDLDEGEEGLGEHEVRLDQVVREVGDRLVYEYDFGDDWEHVLKIEEIRPRLDGEPAARCLGGRRAGPPEDIGGVDRYNHVAAALTGQGDSSLDEELIDWLPVGFDPADFNAGEVDRHLRGLGEG